MISACMQTLTVNIFHTHMLIIMCEQCSSYQIMTHGVHEDRTLQTAIHNHVQHGGTVYTLWAISALEWYGCQWPITHCSPWVHQTGFDLQFGWWMTSRSNALLGWCPYSPMFSHPLHRRGHVSRRGFQRWCLWTHEGYVMENLGIHFGGY